MTDGPNLSQTYHRRPFRQIMLSPLYLFLTIFTLGFATIIIWAIYNSTSKQLWIQDNHLFGSHSSIPKHGYNIACIKTYEQNMTLFSLTLNRTMILFIMNDDLSKPIAKMTISQGMIGKNNYEQLALQVKRPKQS